jgi:hypothetical protein
MKSFQSLLAAFGLVAAAQALNNWSNTTSEAVVWTTITTEYVDSQGLSPPRGHFFRSEDTR